MKKRDEYWQRVNNAKAAELWTKKVEQLFQVISVALEGDCIEPALILIYSGIDAMAWLDRPPGGSEEIGRKGFTAWCNKYLLNPVDQLLTGDDLYAARCGLLHTHTPNSKMFRDGKVTKLFYSRRVKTGEVGYDQMKFDSKWPVWADIDVLVARFRQAVDAFRRDVESRDLELASVVYNRINRHYFVEVDVPERDPLTYKTYDDESRYEDE
jgi:hypothetical protein